MRTSIPPLLIHLLFLSAGFRTPAYCDDQAKFDICINAWPTTVLHRLPSGEVWIDVVQRDYGATGVYLVIPWSFLETGPGSYIFNAKDYGGMPVDIKGSVEAILERGLNLYVRVYYGSVPSDRILAHPSLPETIRLDVSDSTNDFFRHKLGVARRNGDTGTKLVSFHSSKGISRMLAAHSAVVREVKEIATRLGHLDKLKEINPSFTWDDETEYPWQCFVDFSDSAKARFRAFLAERYSIGADSTDFDRLLSRWGDAGSAEIPGSLEEIDIRKYNWADATTRSGDNDPTGRRGVISRPLHEYDFPGGRNDWIEFRTIELGKAIERFVAVNRAEGIKCCIQIGSPFDFLIEKRGWQDITPLLEHADGIRTANIIQRKATFEFEADLVRSVCGFWSHEHGREYVFSTETNWPEYKGFDAETLTEAWSKQLRAFYERGSSAHFVMGWAYWGKDEKGRRLEDYVEIFRDEFSLWRDSLKSYAGRRVEKVAPSNGVYLSTVIGRETHGYSPTTAPDADHCEYFLRLTDAGRHDGEVQLYDPEKRRDIVTTYMLKRDPSYVDLYLGGDDPIRITDEVVRDRED